MINYLPTDQVLADILTKGLPGPKVKTLVEKLDIYHFIRCIDPEFIIEPECSMCIPTVTSGPIQGSVICWGLSVMKSWQ